MERKLSMKNNQSKIVVYILVISLLLSSMIYTSEAEAQYKRREEPLPGMVSGETIIIAVIAGLVVIAAVIIISKKATSSDEGEIAPVDTTQFSMGFSLSNMYQISINNYTDCMKVTYNSDHRIDAHDNINVEYEHDCLLRKKDRLLSCFINNKSKLNFKYQFDQYFGIGSDEYKYSIIK